MPLKKILILILTLAMIISIASCSKVPDEIPEEISEELPIEKPVEEPAAVPEPEPEPEPEQVPEPESEPEPELPPVPEFVNPLTGEEVEEDISLNRPLAVMVNNISVAQPQLGNSTADIICELLVEGGITRMCAIFQNPDGDATIGSIRSSRHYYIDLVRAFDAVYIHCGGSPMATSILNSGSVSHIDAGAYGSLFYRDSYRRSNMGYEHSLCFKMQDMLDYLKGSDFRTEHNDEYTFNWEFDNNSVLPNSHKCNDISIQFSSGSKSSKFEYQEDSGLYIMKQYGSDYIDGNTGDTLQFKNVLLIQTAISLIPGDTKGRLNVTMTGTGTGWYMRDGEYTEINWSRKDENSQYEFTYADGSPVLFGTGKSYFGIVSQATGSVTFE